MNHNVGKFTNNNKDKGWIDLFVVTVRNLLDVLCLARNENVLHDILLQNLKKWFPYIKKRYHVTSCEYPKIEVDLVDLERKMAIEVKLNPKFYEGLQQVLVLRELYGFDTLLFHVYDECSEKILKALEKIAKNFSLPIIILEKRSKRMWCFYE